MIRELSSTLQHIWRHPLNANARGAALGRLLRWQIASRLVPGPIGLPFVEDTRLFASRSDTGATGNWYSGLHEVHEMAFVLHFLRAGERFLDVGANIGSYTVLAAGGARARVAAVEPIPGAFVKLRRNVVLNGLEALVRCERIGLSNRSGTLRFSDMFASAANHVVASGGIEVEVRRLDDLVGDDVPILAKIDVEGHEREVLEGAAATLADPRLGALIMETDGVRSRAEDVDLIAWMSDRGFSACRYDPFARELHLQPQPARNTIFVRDREDAGRRVKAAPRFRVGLGSI